MNEETERFRRNLSKMIIIGVLFVAILTIFAINMSSFLNASNSAKTNVDPDSVVNSSTSILSFKEGSTNDDFYLGVSNNCYLFKSSDGEIYKMPSDTQILKDQNESKVVMATYNSNIGNVGKASINISGSYKPLVTSDQECKNASFAEGYLNWTKTVDQN